MNSMLLDISVKKGDVFLSKKTQTVQPKTLPICAHLFLRWLSFYIWNAHCQLTIFTLVVGTAVCHYQVTSFVYTFLWYFILRNELWESLLWSDLLLWFEMRYWLNYCSDILVGMLKKEKKRTAELEKQGGGRLLDGMGAAPDGIRRSASQSQSDDSENELSKMRAASRTRVRDRPSSDTTEVWLNNYFLPSH